jgi:ABC-2 type transport system permease protein
MNGNLIAFIILQMLIVHIPLLVALVTGDLISGEANMGTIRMLASKPISRTQIVLSKFLAGALYTLLLTMWLGFLSLYVARWIFGTGDLMVLTSDGLIIHPEADVEWRYIYGFLTAYLSLLTVSILFTIIGSMDVTVFDSIKPYLFTTHMAAWRSYFEDPVPWDAINESIRILIYHNVILVAIALFQFNRKDITS